MIDHYDDYTYENVPEFTDSPDGAQILVMDRQEVELKYIPDVVYSVRNEMPLHLQVILPSIPADPERIFPIALYIRGSAWRKQDIYCDVPNASHLASLGYIVAIVEYRHSGIAHFPAPIIDAKNAIRYAKEHAGEWHGDPTRVFLMGGSSGGQIAILAGMTAASGKMDEPDSGTSPAVRGLVDLFGAVDVTMPFAFPSTADHGRITSPEGQYLGFDLNEHPEEAKAAVCRTYIDTEKDFAPILILHGTRDRMCNCEQSVQLYRALKEAGRAADLILVRGSDHGGPAFWTTEICRQYDRFFKKCLEA